MSEEKEPPVVLWRDKKTGKIIHRKKNGRLIGCWTCPCCKPRVIAGKITNGRTGPKEWDLRPGESHHNDSGASCSGTIYYSGDVNGKGKLVGLPDKFVSSYSYNGYMELQQGCVREDGSVEWPCPNG